MPSGRGCRCLVKNTLRVGSNIPDDTKPGEDDKNIVGDIDLPPVHSLTFRPGISVVVVMPPLTKGNKREKKAVSAVIGGLEPTSSPHMGQRVDNEGSVVEKRGAHAKTPDEELKRASPKLRVPRLKRKTGHNKEGNEGEGSDEVVSVQPSKFGKLQEVFNYVVSAFNILCAQDPTHMCPPEPISFRRVKIVLLIGMFVVVPMVRCPPNWPLLSGGGADKAEEKLKPSAGLVSPVGKVAVVATDDSEHSDDVEPEAHKECCPAKADKEDKKTSDMDGPENALFEYVNRIRH